MSSFLALTAWFWITQQNQHVQFIIGVNYKIVLNSGSSSTLLTVACVKSLFFPKQKIRYSDTHIVDSNAEVLPIYTGKQLHVVCMPLFVGATSSTHVHNLKLTYARL